MKMITKHWQQNSEYGCCGIKRTKHGMDHADTSTKRQKRALKRKDRQNGRKEILDNRFDS